MALTAAVAALLGSALGFTGGIFGNLINRSTARQNQTAVQNMNDRNIAFQQAENNITREREDNAYQRAVSDLHQAGLSATLAAGQPSSAQALQAPRVAATTMDYRYDSALQKMNLANTALNLYKLQSDIKTQEQLANYYNSMATGNNIDNSYKALQHETGLLASKARIELDHAYTEKSKADTELTKQQGEWYSRLVSSQIDNYTSSAAYNWQRAATDEKYRDLIVKQTITEVQKASWYRWQSKEIVQKIVNLEVDEKIANYRLDYAKNNGKDFGYNYALKEGMLTTGALNAGTQTISNVLKFIGTGANISNGYSGSGLFGFY